MRIVCSLSLSAMWLMHAPILLAAAPTMEFDCDTPSGHYSQWKTTLEEGTVRVHGSVKVLEPRKEGDWVSGAHIYIYRHDGGALVGLIFAIDQADPTRLLAKILMPERREFEDAFASVTWKDKPIAFDFLLDAAGVVTFSVEGTVQKLELPGFKSSAVGMRCTSGDFLFTGVSIDENYHGDNKQ